MRHFIANLEIYVYICFFELSSVIVFIYRQKQSKQNPHLQGLNIINIKLYDCTTESTIHN